MGLGFFAVIMGYEESGGAATEAVISTSHWHGERKKKEEKAIIKSISSVCKTWTQLRSRIRAMQTH
jgi:hypothetical protein